MEWEIFIGRFHTLLVHLPIGILLLAYLFEWIYFLGGKKIINTRSIIITCYSFGILSGIMASIAGYLLSFHEVYGIQAINLHKNLAISSLLILTVVLLIQWKVHERKKLIKIIASTIAVLLIALTGHFGGNLTHGPEYLVEYGPEFLQKNESRQENLNPDSLMIYPDIIQPIFEENCIACHEAENYKGGLILDNYEDLFKESDSGFPIQKGYPLKSELFTRVTLNSDNKEYMPPEKPGLSFTEIEIFKYWIQYGADSTTQFIAEQMSPELIELVARDFGLDYSPKSYFEKIQVDSIDEDIFINLRNSGFRAKYLSDVHFLLDVEYLKDTITKYHINLLNSISDHATFLNLSGVQLSDKMVEELNGMEHLTRLNLSNNEISTSIPAFVNKSQHLESINLNDTKINNEQLVKILRELNLQSIYIMNSGITEEEITSLRKLFSEVEIISKFQFKEVEKPKSVFEKQSGKTN